MSAVSKIAFAFVLVVAAFEPAVAADTSKKLDPNQRICEDVTAVGSRLATKRVCATRAEWVERRKLDRETLDGARSAQGAIPCSSQITHHGVASC